MPREGVVAEGLELEAALAAEEAWRLREAIASMDRSHDMDVDSPRLLATELGGDGSTVDPNKAIPDGEQQTLEVPIRRSCEDSSERLSRLFATQKRLMEATKDQLPSQARKRMRSASAANTSNTVHDIQSASSPTPVSPVSPVHKRNKRTSSKRSLVWKHFNTGLRGQHPVATCVYCGQEYMCNSSTHGTSTLWNHLRILCPQQPFKGLELPKNQGTPKQSYNIEDCRKALAEMVLIDEMPFKTVEGEGFKRYSKVLQPRFDLPSRVTLARDCMQRYFEEKPKLKKVLKNQRMCLTTDTWTSKQNLCYMCLPGHWIDDQWQLQKRILNFCSVADHKGETLGKRVEECLLEWGIDRLFTVTVDNASSNDKLIGYLKGVCKDWQGVVLNNKFLHVRCCAHIVNLIVKSGLEEHNESIDKIRTAVKFVRSSSSRLNIFKKCAELEKISNKGLLNLDLETRWNSTFLMLEGAEKFEKAFTRLQKDYKPFKAYFPNKDPPDAYDWRTARRILCFLKLFEKVTTRLSASLHVTSSIVFHDIMLMRAKLIEIVGGEDQILSSMANHMKLKFQKYWEEEGNLNYLLFIAVILDPRYKLEYLKFCLDILYGPDEGKELSEKIESALDELFSSYAKTVNTSSSNIASKQAPIHISVDDEDEENPWDMLASQFEQHMEEIESGPTDSELIRYLAEKREKRTKEFDILKYWKISSNKYPVLSLLAKDVLAIPASTVPSESAFSTGGRIIDPLRCSLSTSTVEALICARSWLHTSKGKPSARETAEEVQTYEEIREEFLSKDCADNQHCIGDLIELDT